MAISDKLQTVAENQQFVYKAGYEKGKAEVDNTEEAYNEGLEAGKQAEWSRFWDIFQNYGKRNNWLNSFVRWDNAIYNPKYPFIVKYGSNMYTNASSITDTLQTITFTEDFATVSAVFQSCSNLKTIRNIHVYENMTYGNWFSGCKALENITFTGVIGNNIDFSVSPLLARDSIESIITALSTTATNQTLTLNKTAVKSAFGTDYDTSTEWTTLKNSKSNWTITLS